MKNLLKFFALAAVILGFSATSFGQASADASATGTIVAPITITKDVDMNFGNVAVQASSGGTVVLLPAGTRTATGGVTASATMGGTVTAASFSVAGEGTYTYAITLPTSCIVSDGTHAMTVNTFTSTPSGTGQLAAGVQTLNVGATLNVAAAQTPGSYDSSTGTGTPFTVTVNYN